MEVKIIPTGGLCNRLRAIATGVAVARNYHCPSVIYWNNSLGLKADYCELFKPIPQEDVKLVENKQWLYNINGNKDYLVRWPLLKTMFEKTVFNFSRCTYPQNRQHSIYPVISNRELHHHDGCRNQEECQYQVLCSQR